MHGGSCLCGTVRYEIRGDLGAAYFCHCSRCRKASGSAFAANVVVDGDDFAIVAGADAIGRYRSSPMLVREFCTRCGSPLASRRDGVNQVRVRMGTLDTRQARCPGAHIFVASKADWFEIHDDLPQHADRPA
ncbi:GFA family protein [Dokdonella fugitiva]|uniref:GFA family protein n=1 Tax=Dokdonella fugitiva TaxID=328517 RepID=UPI0015FC1881|nr:GFA family protein [Dokdonella fugitiva]MBA8884079.1 hypothetical protein [Dokdonella fugitiva]